ncbi:hypothetical protein RM697_04890 [Ichthyenterobacterium sp. W332]|uniref:6-phosphogluconate dehydrogenase NADP-binding domain-containing protein n=1 Tax=Microcosmobacter mediterraneus TaxID=3075607 RepID=A0ABU2YJV2_9FLAO|nr:NAD(P)-binding domain-containing protein [Ichthyenterobacterium sp. W332]MDT0557969.1 hypothetical protein [Ichthyenterobacterium sp. W332]
MNKQISIIGCGWFGLPLAKQLLKQGYLVKGTTTSQEKLQHLKAFGILAYSLRVLEDSIDGNIEAVLEGSDILVLNIPPGLRKNPNANYINKIRQLLPFIEKSSVSQLVLISSTSVFKDEFPFSIIYNRTVPNAGSKKAKQLIEVERLCATNNSFKTLIIRFSGLTGNERHPIHMLSGRTDIKNPEAPINLIHLEDCVNIVSLLFQKNSTNNTYNLSYPYHPAREIYYRSKAEALGLQPPTFNTMLSSVGKIIDSSEIETELEYTFKVKI